MGTNFQTLPPLKRFRLLQQQQQQELHPDNKENIPPPLPSLTQLLPAKKRIESRNQPLLPHPPAAVAYSLPTKKRVWAFQPPCLDDEENPFADFGKQPLPLLPLDLNLEYDPCFDCEKNDVEKSEKEENACIDQEIPLSISTSELNVSSESDEGDKKEVDEFECDDDGILCAVCRSTDGDPSDPIVFCDGCDLMVHATCYGDPLVKEVPEGDWFCAECSVSNQQKGKPAPLSCCLCPKQGGGLKPTKKDGLWAHIVCALLIPEVFFEDPDGRQGINFSKVPKRRWHQKCYVCKSKKGCVIECSEPKCPLAFHITCGLEEDLSMEYNQGSKSKEAIVAGFCRPHTDIWEKQQQTGKFKIVARG